MATETNIMNLTYKSKWGKIMSFPSEEINWVGEWQADHTYQSGSKIFQTMDKGVYIAGSDASYDPVIGWRRDSRRKVFFSFPIYLGQICE